MTKPLKPFRDLPALVEHLKDLGLGVDESTAEEYLSRVGYHRLGGYRYVFRQMLPLNAQDHETRRYRSDEYYPGAHLDEVRKLEDWDATLRHIVLRGCTELEIELRAAIAHTVAARDPYGYCDPSNLDGRVCRERSREGTKIAAWSETVDEAEKKARNEDFVIHHRLTYPGSRLPIWALVDILSIGALPYLLDLLKSEDSNEIARTFGARNGRTLATWVRAVADIRNVCAHHSRLFNRSMKRSVRIASRDADPAGYLGHLMSAQHTADHHDPGKKLYSILAVMAAMLRSQQPRSQWPRTLTTHLKKFPDRMFPGCDMPALSIRASCGFPSEWSAQELWIYR